MNGRLRFLLAGLYAWIASAYFGGILVDMAYSNNMIDILGSSERRMVFSEISDTLLCIGFAMVISAIGAIGVSWKSRVARNLFIASLFAFSFEILIPIFSFLIKNPQGLSWVRLFPSGIGSILALVGLYQFYRQ